MAELLGQTLYLLLLLVVGGLTVLSWVRPNFVERWTIRYYVWIHHLMGFKTTMEPIPGRNLLIWWNRFTGPIVLIFLLFGWREVFK